MNFLHTEVKEANGRCLEVFSSNGAAWTMSVAAQGLERGQRITLGIRPEHVALDPNGELRGEVGALEYLGPRTYLHVRLMDGTTLTVETSGDTTVREGDQLGFRVQTGAAHLFDGSGRALTRLQAMADPA